MRLRAAHLACLLLLLSSLGAAEGSATQRGEFGYTGQYIGALCQNAAVLSHEIRLARSLQPPAETSPFASHPPYRAAWTMRPPAAHCTGVHAVTGLATANS